MPRTSIDYGSAAGGLKWHEALPRGTRCKPNEVGDSMIQDAKRTDAGIIDATVVSLRRRVRTVTRSSYAARLATWFIAWSFGVVGFEDAGRLKGEDSPAAYSAEERGHWSLRPRLRHATPTLLSKEHARRARVRADLFVLARLEKIELPPAPPLGFATFARRIFVDLIGRVPMPGELDEASETEEPDTTERLVDRLLASPRFGESWGVHWLDVVRYAESEGFEYDRHRAGAWRYR
ncbi:MAG: hypothetical protein RIS70_3391, partial [Planctomycetota bacterium]